MSSHPMAEPGVWEQAVALPNVPIYSEVPEMVMERMRPFPVPVVFPEASRPFSYTGFIEEEVSKIIISQPMALPATWEQAVALPLFPT